MKIRLASIDGRVGDPIYNIEQLKKEVKAAKEDGINLLVLPANQFNLFKGNNHSFNTNERYQEVEDKAIRDLFNFINQNESDDFEIYKYNIYEHEGLFKESNLNLEIRADIDEIATVEYLSKIEEEIKAKSLLSHSLFLYCAGGSTNSVCRNISSNVKIIACDGKILASNLDTNRLDAEIEEPKLSRTPYLDKVNTETIFENILNLQAKGLYNKMKSMNRFKICLGISGGLDSTVSLAVCVETFKKYGLPLENIIGVTMPGLGTTERTYKNALTLMKQFGITIRDIDLKPLLKMHLKNIDQPEGKFDVTYEQCQSRERTQVLLDIANRDNAIMIGTGCMSEFALGWMSYGGDHLSMYAINIGLPKTVVKMYADWLINKYSETDKVLSETIKDILHGPVSPELLPVDEKGQQHEKTESIIGDYLVQDFFIYHMTVNNYSIKHIFKLACEAFPEYKPTQILKWLEIFTLRYFTRAYKKNCYGDGLQIFEYCVSPFFYEIPSDISNSIWEQEIKELKEELGVN